MIHLLTEHIRRWIHDFMDDQLIYNKTYAHRLPPTLIEQARHGAPQISSDPFVFVSHHRASRGGLAIRTPAFHACLDRLPAHPSNCAPASRVGLAIRTPTHPQARLPGCLPARAPRRRPPASYAPKEGYGGLQISGQDASSVPASCCFHFRFHLWIGTHMLLRTVTSDN
ncbi:hypothetical protein BC827DRAFT_524434 [Russula dissimulans]|nr:hypothetical protein BC827DRAFT_524434 [Russula dissimulans]